ncbi:phage GP46 family protein [Novispirillum itersonii]|uniref:phage GP46 family protein n=1 Tax=Novispirillum itersonii TaxID=189 RepID=UPI00035E04D1|nr:phage GP46 family protein [Novispirillum itersonii]
MVFLLSWDSDIFVGDFDGDNVLHSAVIQSLFTWRRALDSDILPPDQDRMGWWGDEFGAVQNDKMGSRLWLLRREKITEETLKRVKIYTEEALKWMIEDGVASSINVFVERDASNKDRVNLLISIAKPDGTIENLTIRDAWAALK